jgi:NAD(P)-dependent dehydrogenase (short-subunit alcohol dehydrogenase family)
MADSLFDLSGKIALVSGASRGIGEAIARLLAQHGAHVIVSSRKEEDCEAVAASIRDDGGAAEAFPCHVGRMEDIAAIFEHIRSGARSPGYLRQQRGDQPLFRAHPRHGSRRVQQDRRSQHPRLLLHVDRSRQADARHGGGAIVNTASINALQPGPMQGIYSITKAAVVSMTKAFAKECAPLGIRCNALLPGLTKTKFAGALFEHEEIYRAAMEKIPMGRHAEPEEMAGTVLYLVSDASLQLHQRRMHRRRRRDHALTVYPALR